MIVAVCESSLLTVTISSVKQKMRCSVNSVDVGCLRREHSIWNGHLEEWQSEKRKGKYDCQEVIGMPRREKKMIFSANSQHDDMCFIIGFKWVDSGVRKAEESKQGLWYYQMSIVML